MAKIAYDKYYTPPTTARWCIDKVKEVIGEENITEWVEPSAGCGTFSHQIKGCKAYDLYPQHEYIEQADFTKLDLGGYKKGRCFIGNPPFGGSDGKLLHDFYQKACDNGDYIAYIQPASFYKSYSTHKRFEIVYSCIIETEYTNVKLKTSFTIYKRNPDKEHFENKNYSIPSIQFYEYVRSKKVKKQQVKPYDHSFISYGDLMRPAKPFQYVRVMVVNIKEEKYKQEIIKILNWLYYYHKKTGFMSRKHISSSNLDTQDIYRVIRLCIPELDELYPPK